MSKLNAIRTSSVSPSFLRKLIGFYKPRPFTNTSTQFDMGYEQCKRDLRTIIRSEVQDISEYEDFGPVKETVEDRKWYAKLFR